MTFFKGIRRQTALLIFLCVEILGLYLGQIAFYTEPAVTLLSDQERQEIYGPALSPGVLQTQSFQSAGQYLHRIEFYLGEYGDENGVFGKSAGGFTLRLRDARENVLASRYYAAGDLSVWAVHTFETRCFVTPGETCSLEAEPDADCAYRVLNYVSAAGAAAEQTDTARVDGVPLEEESYRIQLDCFYANFSRPLLWAHLTALIAGVLYLLVSFRASAARIAAGLLALAAAAGSGALQLLWRSPYTVKETALTVLPAFLLAGMLCLQGREAWFCRVYAGQAPYRNVSFSWQSLLFLLLTALWGAALGYCGWRFDPQSESVPFAAAALAFLGWCGAGFLAAPRLEEWSRRFPALIFLCCSGLIFAQMEIANTNPLKQLNAVYILFNVLTVLAVLSLLWAVLGNTRAAGLLGTAVFGIWGVANYFTVEFRGIPIAPSDLMSAGTALNVLGSYRITFQVRLLAVLLLIALQVLLWMRVPFRTKPRAKKDKLRWLRRTAAALCAGVLFWFGYYAKTGPVHMVDWNWMETYYPQGYVAVSLAKIKLMFPQKPRGYSPDALRQEALAQPVNAGRAEAAAETPLPNIVFIVNESWFDLQQVADFTTDREATPFLDGLENCVRGFAVNPARGTSFSEYELLTSNNLNMVSGVNPFTQRNMEGDVSIVSYLKALGYTTAAQHLVSETNYNRRIVYPHLGFERIFLSKNGLSTPFSDLRYQLSDETSFQVIRELYETREKDRPAFIYDLTFQNHGGYQSSVQNGGQFLFPEEKYVSVLQGFGAIRTEVEEYLSCLRYTDEAFESLLEYFSACKEPTIVCMVGDHGPAFSEPIETPYTAREEQLRRNGTPFVIWANYPIAARDAGYIGMVQLVPLLLQTANMPLTPYYRTILELSEEYPVLGANFYQKADGSFGAYSYTDQIPENELLKRYFFYEYNNLGPKKERVDALYLP